MVTTRTASKADRPLYETVYESIRQRITEGTLRPGEPVSEVQLAEMLSVSRTPIRDAVRRLVAENLLVMPARGTVRIYAPTAADLADVYCTRAALESMTARLAALNADAPFLRELGAICDRSDALGKRTSVEDDAIQREVVHAAALLNGEFHQAILRKANNSRITQLLANIAPVVVRYRHISLAHFEHLRQSWDEHRKMVQYFAKYDPEVVEALVRTHILKAGGRIVATMMRMEGDTPSSLTPSMELVLKA